MCISSEGRLLRSDRCTDFTGGVATVVTSPVVLVGDVAV